MSDRPLAIPGTLAPPHRIRLARTLRGTLRRAEWGFAAFAILVQAGAIGSLLLEGGSDALSGRDLLVLRALNWPVYGGLALALLLLPGQLLRAARSVPLVLLVVALAAGSALWSVDPAETLDGATRFAASTLLGLYLAARFTPRDLLRILVGTLALAAVLSVVTALLLPGLGIGTGAHAGSWQGVFAHKNIFGRTMALGAAASVLLALERPRRRLPLVAATLLFVALVGLSRSVTAVVVLMTLGCLLPVFLTLQREIRVWVVLVAGMLIAGGSLATFVLSNLEPAMALMGRDTSLTGRTVLWAALIDLVQQRPWLGYGYSAFWGGGDAPSSLLRPQVGWDAAHAHNGFLDLWLQLGLLGVAAFLLAALGVGRWGWRRARRDASALSIWPLMYVAFLLLLNLTESVILREHNLLWALFVATGYAAASRGGPVRPAPAPSGPQGSPPPPLSLGVARRARTVHGRRA